jgi:hypothetical protein
MKSHLKIGIFLCIMSTSSYSQIGFSGYLAIPVGKFASSTDGMAETRFGLALDYSVSILESLSAGVEGNFIMNTVDRQAFANQLVKEPGITSASVSGGTYFNFPIFGTVSYTIPISGNKTFTLKGGLGYDFLNMMDMDLTVNGSNGKIVFDPSGAMAFSLGANLGFGNLFVGAKYMDLGNHKINGAVSGPSGNSNISGDQDIAVTGIYAGIHF